MSTLKIATSLPTEDLGEAPTSASLLLDVRALALLLLRSVPSLRRDDAAGRIPAGLWIGGAKRWRRTEIEKWVAAGCPRREIWNSMTQ